MGTFAILLQNQNEQDSIPPAGGGWSWVRIGVQPWRGCGLGGGMGLGVQHCGKALSPPPVGQTDTCENITFRQLRLRAVIFPTHFCRIRHFICPFIITFSVEGRSSENRSRVRVYDEMIPRISCCLCCRSPVRQLNWSHQHQ